MVWTVDRDKMKEMAEMVEEVVSCVALKWGGDCDRIGSRSGRGNSYVERQRRNPSFIPGEKLSDPS